MKYNTTVFTWNPVSCKLKKIWREEATEEMLPALGRTCVPHPQWPSVVEASRKTSRCSTMQGNGISCTLPLKSSGRGQQKWLLTGKCSPILGNSRASWLLLDLPNFSFPFVRLLTSCSAMKALYLAYHTTVLKLLSPRASLYQSPLAFPLMHQGVHNGIRRSPMHRDH